MGSMLDEARSYLRRASKANLAMAAVNIAVFLVMSLMGNTENSAFMLSHGAAYAPLILQGEYYRLFTSMFLHFGMVHLAYNMICLLSLGDMLESRVGSVRYLVIYLVGGLAGNVVSLLWEMRTGRYAVSAGASGAIFAVIGALLCLNLRNPRRRNQALTTRLAVMSVLMIAQGFLEKGTDNAAHVGGFLAGMLVALLFSLAGTGIR